MTPPGRGGDAPLAVGPGDPAPGGARVRRARRRAAVRPGRHRGRRPPRHAGARRARHRVVDPAHRPTPSASSSPTARRRAWPASSAPARSGRRPTRRCRDCGWRRCSASVLALLGACSAPALVALLGGEGEVAEHALLYLRVSLLGLPALLAVLAGTGYLRGLQDTRTPLVVAVVSATANLVARGRADLRLRVRGRRVGADDRRRPVGRGRRLHPHDRTAGPPPRRRDRARLGVAAPARSSSPARSSCAPSALRSALVLATAVAARIGTVDVAAHQIAFEIWSALALALDALAIAGQAMVGRHLGAVRRRRRRGPPAAGSSSSASRPESSPGSRIVVLARRPARRVHRRPRGRRPDRLRAVVGRRAAAGERPRVRPRRPAHRRRRPAVPRRAPWPAPRVVFAVAAGAVLVTGAGLGWLWAAIGVFMVARAVPLLARWRDRRLGHRRRHPPLNAVRTGGSWSRTAPTTAGSCGGDEPRRFGLRTPSCSRAAWRS